MGEFAAPPVRPFVLYSSSPCTVSSSSSTLCTSSLLYSSLFHPPFLLIPLPTHRHTHTPPNHHTTLTNNFNFPFPSRESNAHATGRTYTSHGREGFACTHTHTKTKLRYLSSQVLSADTSPTVFLKIFQPLSRFSFILLFIYFTNICSNPLFFFLKQKVMFYSRL